MSKKEHKTKHEEEMNIPTDEANATKSEASQLEEYRDQLLRLAAEFDNYRKRSRADAALLVWQAKKELITGILPVLDGFARAIAATKEESTAEGLKLLAKQLATTLENAGLAPIAIELKSPFDPETQDALVNIATDQMPDGCVVDVLEEGYMLDGRLMRPARVGVSCPLPEKEEAQN